MGPAYRTFAMALREYEQGEMHDGDIIAFLDTLPSQKKSKWVKAAIREKMKKDVKRNRPMI